MNVVADENFPGPALTALRTAGWDVFSILEECPGISDEDVAALCTEQERILLTFDKDFGELIFRRGLAVGSGVVLFRIATASPEEAASVVLALVESQVDLKDNFLVVTKEKIRVRPISSRPFTA